MKKFIKNIFIIFLPLIVGGIVSIIIKDSIDYDTLVKPALSPPSIFFPIAWTIIYTLMGISYFIVRKTLTTKEKLLYYIQLAVNALWSIIFFVNKMYFLSIVWIVLLDVLVIIMIRIFIKENKISGILQIPYLLWILFATYLTIGIYILN